MVQDTVNFLNGKWKTLVLAAPTSGSAREDEPVRRPRATTHELRVCMRGCVSPFPLLVHEAVEDVYSPFTFIYIYMVYPLSVRMVCTHERRERVCVGSRESARLASASGCDSVRASNASAGRASVRVQGRPCGSSSESDVSASVSESVRARCASLREVRESVWWRDHVCEACERIGVSERVRVRGRPCGSSSESDASASLSESMRARCASLREVRERVRRRDHVCEACERIGECEIKRLRARP
jgi:hypothetical protein